MTTFNMPVEMIALYGAEGRIRPLRFRFEDAAQQLHTVKISQVLLEKEIHYLGLPCYVYTCSAVLAGKETLFELRYLVKAHRWFLFQLQN